MSDRPDLTPAQQQSRLRILLARSDRLADLGLLDPDQPTWGATVADQLGRACELCRRYEPDHAPTCLNRLVDGGTR